jgi:aspartate kinase
MRVGFTIAKGDLDLAKKAIGKLVDDKGYKDLKVSTESGLAKVSVVGTGMRSYSGVAGRTFSALTANDIDIHMISTSEIKISVVVDEKSADKSVAVLHKEFIA